MEHEHEAHITLDNKLLCRTCGDFLEQAKEEISKVSSKRTANRILNELAVAGSYMAASYENGFTVFSKSKDGITEEITCERIAIRDYRIIKRLIAKEVKD